MTSNLRLNATVNPDFGQVEVDPAVVNLTAFETFFDEKRPFFLEGSQIFTNFGYGGSNNFWGFNTSEPTIFYSRRIGRAPQLSAAGDFVDAPTATTILGAAKLTGKTGERLERRPARGGHRSRDGADAWLAGHRRHVRPSSRSPTTSSAGCSAIWASAPGAGFLATAVNRRLDTQAVPRRARRPGVSVRHRRAPVPRPQHASWVVTGKVAVSHVSGSPAFIQRLQRAPQRYYQRPDAHARGARSVADGAHRRQSSARAEPQQRHVVRQRAAVGQQPRVREQRPRLPRHRRSRRRPCRLLPARQPRPTR